MCLASHLSHRVLDQANKNARETQINKQEITQNTLYALLTQPQEERSLSAGWASFVFLTQLKLILVLHFESSTYVLDTRALPGTELSIKLDSGPELVSRGGGHDSPTP